MSIEQVEKSMVSEADQHIAFVIRIFRYIGWPFSVFSILLALFFFPLSVYGLLTQDNPPIVEAAIILTVIGCSIPFFLSFLLVVGKMKRREESARVLAKILLAFCILVPVFSKVARMCWACINRYYDDYCREA